MWVGVNVVTVAMPLDCLIVKRGGRRGNGKTSLLLRLGKMGTKLFSIPEVKVTVGSVSFGFV